MQNSGRFFSACLAFAVVAAAPALAGTDTVSKAGATKVVVTIPVHGAPSSFRGVGTIPELLSRVCDLSAAERKQILDAVQSGFVTAVRLEAEADGHSSWLELPAAGPTLSRGDSTFRFQEPKLVPITDPRPRPQPAGTPPAK